MMLSVIVPVYNAGVHLEQCLCSIQNQTYQNFEVILVDDGSTDLSGKICDKIAAQDRRFRVLHRRKEGLVAARIAGLMAADGEWIAFVDADDWIDNDFLGFFMECIERQETDVVVAGCTKETGSKKTKLFNRIPSGFYEEEGLVQKVFPAMLYFTGFFEFGILPYMWNKLYKRRLLLQCYENIDKFIYDGEDAAVVYPYLLQCKKVIITDAVSYHYRIHNESLSAVKRDSYYENTARLYLHLKRKFAGSGYYGIMLPQLDQYMRMMVWQGGRDNFTESQKHWFPFVKVPEHARIILYGAGHVGKVYYYQIKQTDYCEVAAWIDKNKAGANIHGVRIEGIECLSEFAYDYVVIAVAGFELKERIADELRLIGVERNRIIL